MAPQTTEICLTQALLDKFGAPLPKLNGNCRITHLDKKADSVSAEMVCTGATVGKATMQSTWTSNSTSAFKSADCGSVKPFPMPEE